MIKIDKILVYEKMSKHLVPEWCLCCFRHLAQFYAYFVWSSKTLAQLKSYCKLGQKPQLGVPWGAKAPFRMCQNTYRHLERFVLICAKTLCGLLNEVTAAGPSYP